MSMSFGATLLNPVQLFTASFWSSLPFTYLSSDLISLCSSCSCCSLRHSHPCKGAVSKLRPPLLPTFLGQAEQEWIILGFGAMLFIQNTFIKCSIFFMENTFQAASSSFKNYFQECHQLHVCKSPVLLMRYHAVSDSHQSRSRNPAAAQPIQMMLSDFQKLLSLSTQNFVFDRLIKSCLFLRQDSNLISNMKII